MISRELLSSKYLGGKSMQAIAKDLGCSANKIKYWMMKYRIPVRSISEAVYLVNNPNGDPFKFIIPRDTRGVKLFGLGLGLYWGEGNKSNKNSIRLGNSDPALIKNFIMFMDKICGVPKDDLSFGLQLFNDIDANEALHFWKKSLAVKKNQFQKVIITPSRGAGTYRKKSIYGVLTLYYHNKKLRDLLCEELKKMGFYG